MRATDIFMKKIFPAGAAFVLIACIFSSCAFTQSGDDSASGAALQYDNSAVIENASNEYYELSLKSPTALSGSETLELFDELYEKYFANTFSYEEKQDQCRFIADEVKPTDDEYPYCYPKISEHYKEIENGSFNNLYLFLDTHKGHLAVTQRGLYILDHAKTFALEGEQGIAGMYFPKGEVVGVYYAPSDESFKLFDKSVTVMQAKETAERLLNEQLKTGDLKACADITRVINMGDYCGFSFAVTPSYMGIPFDFYEGENVRQDNFSNGKEYNVLPALVFMLESDKTDIVIGFSRYELKEARRLESIMSLEECAGIVRDKFSDMIKLTANKIQLVYTVEIENDDSFKAQPAWKFSVTEQNGEGLYIYVNAVTGECYYQRAD